MSRQATEFQKKEMSKMYRGKEIFKPLNTGWVDEHVACVREWVANIFFYRKGPPISATSSSRTRIPTTWARWRPTAPASSAPPGST